nr:hypothetical protein [Marinicella sp. W31]MDC2879266.1 hypothetical protein [Marinicella sp. W31]
MTNLKRPKPIGCRAIELQATPIVTAANAASAATLIVSADNGTKCSIAAGCQAIAANPITVTPIPKAIAQ